VTLPCDEITFSDGTEVVCSDDHRWLVKWGNVTEWRRTDMLEPGVSMVSRPLTTWKTVESYGAGYLAAAFDGEGWYSRGTTGGTHAIGFAQRENEMLDKVRAELKEHGFAYNDYLNHKPQPANFTRSEDIHTLTIIGVLETSRRQQRRPETLRFLGMIRPARLLSKFSVESLGSMYYAPWVTVSSVRFIGPRRVIALQTSSRTFFAEGFAAHNCILKVGADGQQFDTWVTWGALQRSSRSWSAACLDEAWVIVSEDDAKAASLDIAALRRDIDALHGTGGS